jgi:hypothetical protein
MEAMVSLSLEFLLGLRWGELEVERERERNLCGLLELGEPFSR